MTNIFDGRSLTPEQQARYEWAEREYARIQRENTARNPHAVHDFRPSEKSALFYRLLEGKSALSHPPPTSFNFPWYEIIEQGGPFDVVHGGTLPSWKVPHHKTNARQVYLDYLVINQCPWGVIGGNQAAANLSDALSRLRDCRDRDAGEDILGDIADCIEAQPEWVVSYDPWPDYRVYLGRTKRQGKRGDIENARFFRHSLDGTNREISRVLIDGCHQLEGKHERLMALRDKPQHLLSPYEIKALCDLDTMPEDPAALDWCEFECDGWHICGRTSAPDNS